MNARALKILLATKLVPLLLLLPAVAQAQYYYTNGLEVWSYYPNTGPVTITGYSGPGVTVVIPSTIHSSPVTGIGSEVFFGYTSLSSITIPDSVTSIGEDAFGGCTNLTDATIGNGVTSIGDYAFIGCSSLASVTIPGSITNIGWYAFASCETLTNVTIPAGVIGEDAFAYCDSMTNVTILARVTSIGDGAFFDCYSLTAIDVDEANENYSSVDGVLFDKSQDTLIQCPGGKEGDYTIPPGVDTIDSEAFYDCYLLTTVTILNSVTSLGEDAFDSCSSLASATIGNGVPGIGGTTFAYCDSLTNVTMGSGVTSIGANAFESCYSLPSITIGIGVTSIGSGAFADCDSLATVYFQGNSSNPTNDLSVFQDDTTGIVYYQPSTTGWGALFDGWPTMSNVVSSVIGSVSNIVGNVTVTHMGGQPQPLNLNDPIQQGDVIVTDKSGVVNLVFVDGTTYTIGHNVNIAIDEYVYDPNAHTGTAQYSILRSIFVYTSGLIGKNAQEETAYGSIGERGTQFIVQLDACSSNEVVYLIEGELAITPKATGVTNIVDAPATIVFDASNFSTSALTQATYDAMLAQVNQTDETFASWQVQYFDCTNDPDAAPAADPSGDGQDNYTKFLAGMNPTNPASYFHILSATPEGNNLLVSWLCGGGRTNVLQTTTDLGGTWSDVSPNIVLAGSGDSVTNYLDAGAVTNTPARFYRVQLVQ